MSAMYSERLKEQLEHDVIGQPGAINMVVRGVTRAVSGIVARPGPLSTFLLMGPAGTGRSHLARTLCRVLHGDESRFLAADCTSIGNADPWSSFVVQLMPLFRPAQSAPVSGWAGGAIGQQQRGFGAMHASPGHGTAGTIPPAPPFGGLPGQVPGQFPGQHRVPYPDDATHRQPSRAPHEEAGLHGGADSPFWPTGPAARGAALGATVEAPPYSVLVVGELERGRPEFGLTLIRALRTGHLPLPGGCSGSLANCIVFLTSSLCSDEILAESPGIGFSAAREAEEARAHTFKLCSDAAIKHWGVEMIARLDDLIVFHKLEESHLTRIAERLVDDLNERLSPRGFRCELTANATSFLLERGTRDPRMGARCLVRAHRKHLEFPVADLTLSGRVPEGGLVRIDRKEGDDHLHFDVLDRPEALKLAEIPVA